MKQLIWYIDRDEKIGKVVDAEFRKLTNEFDIVVINNPLRIDDKLKEELPALIFIEAGLALEAEGGLVKDLKMNNGIAKVPFVIFGSDVRLLDQAKKLEAHALKKPFDVKQLLEKVKELVPPRE